MAMLLNFIFVPNLGKISHNIGSLGINCGLRRNFTQQVWEKKTSEIIKSKGKIIVIENEESWKKYKEIISRDVAAVNAVGFDCEWNCEHHKRKPVALLQLATYLGNCFLIRLNSLQNNIPPSLQEILENRKILKVGVSCDKDASYFAEDLDVNVNGWFDLRHLAVKDDLKNCKIGLKSLASHYLKKKPFIKKWDLSSSNWESRTLNQRQVAYAAEDANVGIRILLVQLKNLWKPVFEESWETSVCKAIEEVCEPFVEVEFDTNIKFCYVCGRNEVSVQKEVVPLEYRKYFPPLVQLDTNRTLILLCNECHEGNLIKEDGLRQNLAEEFDAPIGDDADTEEIMANKVKAVNAARILRGRGNLLTVGESNYLIRILRKFFETNVLTEDLINQAADMYEDTLSEKCNFHSYKVFRYYEKVGLIHLQTRWRQWFLDSMKPKYLPDHWIASQDEELSQLKIKMSRYPVDSEIRGFYKLILVGRDGDLDVPHKRNIKEDLRIIKELK